MDLPDGVQCTAVWPIGVLLRLQVGLEDRLQDQHRRHLHHPVPDRGDPQRPLLAIRLGDVHPPHRMRSIRSLLSSSASSSSHRSTPYASMSSNVWPSTPAAPPLALQQCVGERQHVPSVHLVVQRVEAIARAIPSLWHATPSAASEPYWRLLGSSPISRLSSLLASAFELRPLPSTGITRLPRYYGPLRHPRRPGLSLASVRLTVIARPPPGVSRVASDLPVSACRRHYPGGTDWASASLVLSQRRAAFPD